MTEPSNSQVNYPSVVQAEPKKAFASQLSIEQIKKFDFTKLSQKQRILMDELSFFTPHTELLTLLTNQFGQTKRKELFIKQNTGTLSVDQFAEFNKAKFQYNQMSSTFAVGCTAFLTFSGFLVGMWVLPARKSPWKYTFAGLVTGGILSYGFWRWQMYRYQKRINCQFSQIIKEKYLVLKRVQRENANKQISK